MGEGQNCFCPNRRKPTTNPLVRESGSNLNVVNILDRWVSGLNQQFTKLPSGKLDREFKSRPIRQNSESEETDKAGDLATFTYRISISIVFISFISLNFRLLLCLTWYIFRTSALQAHNFFF